MTKNNFQTSLVAYLQLMRPANIITAIADILAGCAIAISFKHQSDSLTFIPTEIIWLILSTIGLYGGGVVFNDVFDAKLDAIERPERAIPSGRASKTGASILGLILLAFGVLTAWQVSEISAILALFVAVLALAYDFWGKHQNMFGPINMGVCRGGNLLLGVSIVPTALDYFFPLAIIPIIYIAAITMVSRGEVNGGNKIAIITGAIFYLIVLSLLGGAGNLYQNYFTLQALPFILLFAYLVYPPLIKALKTLQPQHVGKAVKAGVLALIVLDAALAAGFFNLYYGLGVLLLLPISIFIAKLFAVT
ncbi:MAG: polyprenyltransferase [Thalassobius sp.]|nr:polyprenyltransferase [Thalassovita sp.]